MKSFFCRWSTYLLVCGVAFGGGHASARDLSVGYILPLTGDAAAFGIEARRGIELAIEDLSREGLKIHAQFEDEKCLPKDAVSAWQKLSRVDKLQVIVGPTCTGSIVATAAVAEKEKRPLIALWDAGREVENSGPNVYSLGFSSEAEGLIIADYLKRKGLSRIGIFWEEDKFAVVVKESLTGALQSSGAEITGAVSVPPGEQEVRAPLTKIVGGNPDAIFLSPAYSTVAAVQTLRRLGWKGPILGQDTFGFPGVIESASPAMEGVIFSDFALVDKNEKARAVEGRYHAKYGSEPVSSLFVAFGYDSLLIAAATPSDVQLQAQALKKITWSGALPFSSFKESRMLRLRPSLFTVKEGKRVALN